MEFKAQKTYLFKYTSNSDPGIYFYFRAISDAENSEWLEINTFLFHSQYSFEYVGKNLKV